MIQWLQKQCCKDIAVEAAGNQITYGELIERVVRIAQWIKSNQISVVALYSENCFDWIAVDLACQVAGVVNTPIPCFFTQTQFEHVLSEIQPNIIFSDKPLPFEVIKVNSMLELTAYKINQSAIVKEQPVKEQTVIDGTGIKQTGIKQTGKKQTGKKRLARWPDKTSKITFTSGSTGEPKGVCLSVENQLIVAQSLVEAVGLNKPRHLILLPLATLLENIAGVYSPLLAGGTVIIPDDKQRGFSGSRLVNVGALLECICRATPDSLILVPELLLVLVSACKKGWSPPNSLKFIAVGGAKVSAELIQQARALKLPVYQGYGLSECSSVVCLSTSNDDSTESVGKVLPHLSVQTVDGELVVRGNTFLGYLGQRSTWGKNEVRTGDIAQTDSDGVTILGRIGNVIINSLGRNISPEWVESEILATSLFQQVLVVGEAQPFLLAIVVPACSELSDKQLESALSQVNNKLPDYAHVRDFIRVPRPMDFASGLVTANGRLKRQRVIKKYQKTINEKYHVNHTLREHYDEFVSKTY